MKENVSIADQLVWAIEIGIRVALPAQGGPSAASPTICRVVGAAPSRRQKVGLAALGPPLRP